MQSKKYWNLKKKLKKIYYKIFIHYIHYFCASFYKKNGRSNESYDVYVVIIYENG